MLEVRDAKDVVGYHGHRVTWRDEEAVFPEDHVTVLENQQQGRGYDL